MNISWKKMVPESEVSDFSASLEFYTKLLGFRVLYARHNPEFAYLEQEDLQLMLVQGDATWPDGPFEKPYRRGINLQMELADIQPVYERPLVAGTPPYRDLEDTWREAGSILAGQREFWVQDPDGYLLRFCQPLEDRPLGP